MKWHECTKTDERFLAQPLDYIDCWLIVPHTRLFVYDISMRHNNSGEYDLTLQEDPSDPG